MKTNIPFLITLFFLFCISCKKDKDKDPTSGIQAKCNLLAESKTDNMIYKYQYNLDNKLIKEFLNDSLINSIAYEDDGNTIIETKGEYKITYRLDATKRVASIETENDDANFPIKIKEHYKYDANSILTMIVREYNIPGSQTKNDTTLLTNTIINNNVTKVVTTSADGQQSIYEYSYDMSRPNNIPIPKPYAYINASIPAVSKNLLTGLRIFISGYDIDVEYTYEFDAKGRIVKVHFYAYGLTQTQTTNYTYLCN